MYLTHGPRVGTTWAVKPGFSVQHATGDGIHTSVSCSTEVSARGEGCFFPRKRVGNKLHRYEHATEKGSSAQSRALLVEIGPLGK